MYIKAGNKKISNNCIIFNLPTSVCFGCGKQCAGCYAKKAEYMYPDVLPCRENNLEETRKSSFISKMNEKLKRTKKPYFRIHESGDFYNQSYIDKWVQIAKDNSNKKFYAYTKKLSKFDFSQLDSLENVNIINSKPAKGLVNYGNIEYLKELNEKYGYDICPCGIVPETKGTKMCMNTCTLCLTSKKVCLLKH